MVCSALSPTHDPGKQYIMPIGSTNQDVIQQMPVLGSGVHPCSLKLVPLLEDGICNDQIKLGARVEQVQAITV